MTRWLTDEERVAWVRLAAVLELLPGVLDTQLRRDADLSHFEYFVLAMLSEAPERTLRMTSLAARTNATLPRLSHVVRRLEDRGLVRRFPCPEDGRARPRIERAAAGARRPGRRAGAPAGRDHRGHPGPHRSRRRGDDPATGRRTPGRIGPSPGGVSRSSGYWPPRASRFDVRNGD